MDELLFLGAAFFPSVLGILQLQGHTSPQKSFKPGCLWVSQSHRVFGARRDLWRSSSPGRVRFGVDQAVLPSLI